VEVREIAQHLHCCGWPKRDSFSSLFFANAFLGIQAAVESLSF
jgi:hypothetical protein